MTIILAAVLAIVWLAGFALMLCLTDMSGAHWWRQVIVTASVFFGWPVYAAIAVYGFVRYR